MGADGLRSSRRFVAVAPHFASARKPNFWLSPPPETKKPASAGFVIYGGGRTRTAELRRGGIYSPLQLPLCDTPEIVGLKFPWKGMLAKGIEPSTIRLQVGRSTN